MFAFWPGLLLLAAVPLIVLWHLRRLWHRRVLVATVEPWRHLVGASRRRRRLPRTLLLALQAGAAACLGLAAGAPIPRGAVIASRDVAIVLDTSAAIAGDMDAAVRSALDASETSGQVTIVGAGRSPTALLARGTAAQAAAALGGARAGEAGSALPEAIALARRTGGEQAELVVISQVPAPEAWPGTWIEISGTELVDNAAVTTIWASEGRLLATVANFGDAHASLPVRAEADGALIDRRVVELEPGESVDMIWPLPAGAVRASVHLESTDAIGADNDGTAAVVPERVGQLVGSSAALERALESLPGWRFRRAGRATYSVDGSVDLSVFAGEAPDVLPPGGVLVVASALTDTVAAATALAPPDSGSATQAGIAAGQAPSPAEAPPSPAEAVPLQALGDHELASGLDLAGARVRPVAAVRAPDWAEPFLTAGGVTAGYAGEGEGNRLVVLAFDPDDPDASLVKRPAFPILIARAADWLAPETPSAVPAGSWVELPGGERAMAAPDGSVQLVDGAAHTSLPGLYSFDARPSGRSLSLGALAGDGSASDLRGTGPAALDVTAVTTPTVEAGEARADASISVGPQLAMLALLIVLAEGLWRGAGVRS